MRITSLLMAAAVAAALFLWFGGASRLGLVNPPEPEAPVTVESPAAEPSPAPVAVIVYTSKAVDHAGEIVLRGRTEAQRRVEVSAETTGLVISEPFRRGTAVVEGDVLCSIDPGPREAELAEAQARLAEAEAEFNAADRLKDRGYGSETKAIAMQAMLQSAEAGVRRVALDMDRLTIRAPFDGILETDAAELGSYLTPGAHCATLLDLDPMTVTGFVSETEVAHLAQGQDATVNLLDGSVLSGKVTYISRSADPETRTFRVDVTVPNEAGDIRDGLTAEIRIALPPIPAHLVPQSALTLDDDGRIGVRSAENGTVAFHPVTILADRQDGAWLTGLPEQLDIIVQGQEFVRAGGSVAVTALTPEMLQGLGQ